MYPITQRISKIRKIQVFKAHLRAGAARVWKNTTEVVCVEKNATIHNVNDICNEICDTSLLASLS
jgi:hypothetical protein